MPARAAVKKGYSPELLAAVDAALRVHERDRPQTIEEFADILEGRSAPRAMIDPAADDDATVPPHAVGQVGGQAGAQPGPSGGGKGFPTRLVLIAVAVIVLGAAAGGAYYIISKNAEAERLAEERRKAEARRKAEELRQRQAEAATPVKPRNNGARPRKHAAGPKRKAVAGVAAAVPPHSSLASTSSPSRFTTPVAIRYGSSFI